ncbi:hypothetical protein BCR35DRAFT_30717 [Leucosporidium creatinivorum]|uniref:Uncharacterized protein n=1 Tax=Leucosporidium creatinivorum TaxID=106004 RepID=A0A1Y2FVM4_9BASI|nr:hypothetical protein BCR35DRAFT_30717 [Leucosporidium creatinivorum]
MPPAWTRTGNYTYTGGGGNGCLPMGAPGGDGTNDGGIGGPSGWQAQLQGGATSAPALNPTLAAATGADGSLLIDFDCIPFVPVEQTTTLTETLPSSTATITESDTVYTVYTTPSTAYRTATVSAESVQPLQSATVTYVPPTSSFTDYADVTTTPPTSFEYSTVTPDVSSFTETITSTFSPDTQTISSTYVPPTSFFTEAVSQTETPATSTISSTIYPATQTNIKTVDVSTTPATSTKTAVVTSSTGVTNCVSFRMVYPAACCPNTYLSMTKATRARRSIALDKRALTTTQVTDGIT